MKAVMISIRPEWCEKIASGEKTVEVRKTRPKIEPPFRCYIYATKPKRYYKVGEHLAATDENLYLSGGKVKMSDGFEFWADGTRYEYLSGKVIGEFVCENIDYWHISHLVLEQNAKIVLKGTCLTKEEVEKYIGYEWGKNIWEKPYEFFGWNISDLKIYDNPKKLSEFCSYDVRTYIGENGYLMPTHQITRPPQSWCYVEEVTT